MTVRPGVWIVAGFAALGLFGRCVATQDHVGVDPPSSESMPDSKDPSVDRTVVDPKGVLPSRSTGIMFPVFESDTVVDPETGETAYRIRFKYDSERPLYFIIENEYRERGGFLGTLNLTYATRASDRRSIIQRRLPSPPVSNPVPDQPRLAHLKWECDRYEFREKGMADEVKYDSLRDLYPVEALRQLGTIAGSTVTFAIDPQSGETRNNRITLGRMTAPATRKKLSSLANRCTLNRANLQRLQDDLGALFLPGSPKRIGETWTRSRRDKIPNFGHSIIDYHFTLAEVRDMENRHLARIEIGGNYRLEPAPTREGELARKRAGKRTDYQIDSASCTGRLEFDITRGELISLVLRRESDLSAKMASKDDEPMTVEKGASQVLRVAVSADPPPKPTIVGGPKPPVEKNAAKRGARRQAGRTVKDPNAARQRAARQRTTRPRSTADPRKTERPRVGPPRRIQPAPARPIRRSATSRPTTQPSVSLPNRVSTGPRTSRSRPTPHPGDS